MNDLISRSVLLEEMEKLRLCNRHSDARSRNQHNGEITGCIKKIKIQPTVAPAVENRWIPVSERLPEEEKDVIISTKDGKAKTGFFIEHYGFASRSVFMCSNGIEPLEGVAAWMPLPESYKED